MEQWSKCLQFLKDNLPAEQYHAWFAPISVLDFSDGVLTLRVPSQFFVEQIEERYLPLLSTTLHKVYGAEFRKLRYNVEVAAKTTVTIDDENASPLLKKRQALGQHYQEAQNDIDPQLNPRNTFENYCASMSNKLAVSIGQAIATNPDCKTFNPLFVFGPTGVGKTHLIQAIGIKMKENNPRLRVLYVTSRVFENQYIIAVKNNNVPDFINFYQSIDVLIIDDIQELAGKQATQNTFYHIFNSLHGRDKQLIMSSDCRPSEMDGMIPRLISRFKWGMTVELSKPDYELRRDVLELKASQDGLAFSEDVLEFIASNVTDSIRELEGVVVSLLAHATMLDQEISVDLARAVVANAVKINKRQVTFELIAEKVADHCNIDSALLYGKSRKREISDARQLLMYFAKRETQLSSTNIGLRLNRNHATVLHACKQIEERLTVEKAFQEEVQKILEELHK
ncbi:MAG: chromosomal replication initiator protein DnaA [Bacteroidales bacterium]|nr:chromosomal replication initiator protein DnaA [Bacteroidales bacterium]